MLLNHYLTHRLTHSDVETRKILSKLFTLLHLLDTTSLDCRKAISSEMADYEDVIMVETAIRPEMDCIVTRNVKDYAKSSVKVYEPSAFLNLFEVDKTKNKKKLLRSWIMTSAGLQRILS